MNAATLRTQTARSTQTEHDLLRDENVRLVNRIQQLRAALEASVIDNAQLRRALARARAENRMPQGDLPAPQAHHDRHGRIRAMLSDPGCRNP